MRSARSPEPRGDALLVEGAPPPFSRVESTMPGWLPSASARGSRPPLERAHDAALDGEEILHHVELRDPPERASRGRSRDRGSTTRRSRPRLPASWPRRQPCTEFLALRWFFESRMARSWSTPIRRLTGGGQAVHHDRDHHARQSLQTTISVSATAARPRQRPRRVVREPTPRTPNQAKKPRHLRAGSGHDERRQRREWPDGQQQHRTSSQPSRPGAARPVGAQHAADEQITASSPNFSRSRLHRAARLYSCPCS